MGLFRNLFIFSFVLGLLQGCHSNSETADTKVVRIFAASLNNLDNPLGKNSAHPSVSGQLPPMGGSNYLFYDLGDTLTTGVWDNTLRPVIGTYHLNPTAVESQLRQFYQNGQRKIALLIWHDAFISPTEAANGFQLTIPDVYNFVINSAGGTLSTQHQANLQAILNLIQSIGFNQVTIRFAPAFQSNPTTWTTWSDANYQTNWQFIQSTHQFVESTLNGASIERLYDLGVELAGIPHVNYGNGYIDGQSPQYTRRLWLDYISKYGLNDTYGFSIIAQTGYIKQAIANYDSAGSRPNHYAIDFYSTDLSGTYSELNAAGESNKPLIIQETFSGEDPNASAVLASIQNNPSLPIAYIDQWPTNPANAPALNYGAYGPDVSASGTIIAEPCTLSVGQDSCKTIVSYASSNASAVTLIMNGNPVVSGNYGSVSVSVSIYGTTFQLQSKSSSFAKTVIYAKDDGSVPYFTSAGLGGTADNWVWALGKFISGSCKVDIYTPDWSIPTPLATMTSVNCDPTEISFPIPAWIQQKYSAVNFNVVNANGVWSPPFYVSITPPKPVVTSAGLGGTGNDWVWATGSSISKNCSVNLYPSGGVTQVALATLNQINCDANEISFPIPSWIQQQYSEITFTLVNASGVVSNPYSVSIAK